MNFLNLFTMVSRRKYYSNGRVKSAGRLNRVHRQISQNGRLNRGGRLNPSLTLASQKKYEIYVCLFFDFFRAPAAPIFYYYLFFTPQITITITTSYIFW